MLMEPQAVFDGVMSYAEAEVMPALDGWKQWTGAAALVLLYRRADAVLPALLSHPVVSALGIVDSTDGSKIDVDAAIEAMKETAKRRGKLTIELPVFDKLSFSEGDFDKLREHITKAGG